MTLRRNGRAGIYGRPRRPAVIASEAKQSSLSAMLRIGLATGRRKRRGHI